MAKKKDTQPQKEISRHPVFIKFVRLSIVIICSLMVYALLTKNSIILEDWGLLEQFKLSTPINSLVNPVGIFGAISAYYLSYGFGNYFAILLLSGFVLKNLFSLFGEKTQNIRHHITLSMGLFFFVQLLVTSLFFPQEFSSDPSNATMINFGYLSYLINRSLQMIIGINGTRAFIIITVILNILLIFGWEPVKTTFLAIIKSILFPFFMFTKKNSDSNKGKKAKNPTPVARALIENKSKKKAKKKNKETLQIDDESSDLPLLDNIETDDVSENDSFDSGEEQEEDDDEIININLPPVIHEEKEQTISEKKSNTKTIESDLNSDFQIKTFEEEKLAKAEKSESEIIDSEEDRPYKKPNIDKFLTVQKVLTDADKLKIQSQINEVSKILISKLAEFGIEAKVVNVNIGPVITQYELEPAPGIKVNKFSSYEDDLKLALCASSIRVQAPIPGRGLVGIELPNSTRDNIYLKEVLLSKEHKDNKNPLTVALGKDIGGKPIVANLSKAPHLLIAGTTGSGKSVCINAIITTLLLRTTPDELRMIMIDPKRVELSGYADIPHLLRSVVTEPDEAIGAFNWAVQEMEHRYELLRQKGVRDRSSYVKMLDEYNNNLSANEEPLPKMPYIVIIVDEYADLIMTAGKDIEAPIQRLAQMARAVGIHLILATQRPSRSVITGIIKTNFPSRIAFKVSSNIDSRVILDKTGAENLLGMGDMLYLPSNGGGIQRIHGCFVSDKEINNIVDYLRKQPKPSYQIEEELLATAETNVIEYDDELFIEAAKMVIDNQTASVSMLQRGLRVGYARAGRLIDLLEKAGIVGKHQGSKSREVIGTISDIEKYY